MITIQYESHCEYIITYYIIFNVSGTSRFFSIKFISHSFHYKVFSYIITIFYIEISQYLLHLNAVIKNININL